MLWKAPVSHVSRFCHVLESRGEESGGSRESYGREEGHQHEVKAI